MSEKFVFECIWADGGAMGNDYVDENAIDVSIGETRNLPSFDDFQKLVGKRVRITIEPLPVAPMSIGTIRYDPNAKPTPKKPLEPIIHPKYGLLVCEYDYTKPWTWFIAKDYLLEIGDDWIKVYHEAWKGGE